MMDLKGVPVAKRKAVETALANLEESRKATTQAEISLMESIKALFGVGAKETLAMAPARGSQAQKQLAGNVPGAGTFKCPNAKCEHNKNPFRFKMHAVIHAKASKHGKPVEVKTEALERKAA